MTSVALIVLVTLVVAAAIGVVVVLATRTRRPPSPPSPEEDQPNPVVVAEPVVARDLEQDPEPEPTSEPETESASVSRSETVPEPEFEPDPERVAEQAPIVDPDPVVGPDAESIAEPARILEAVGDGAEAPAQSAAPLRVVHAEPLAAMLHLPPTPLSDVTLAQLGVGRAAVDLDADPVPYVPRDVDPSIDQALAEATLVHPGDLVVVRGGPSSGLTRCVVEAVRRTGANRPVLAVATPAAMPSTFAEAEPFAALVAAIVDDHVPVPREAVVFIDGAEEHLGRGLTYANIERLLRALPGSTVALTIDAGRMEVPDLVVEPTEGWLRDLSEGLEVRAQLSDEELARATAGLSELAHQPQLRSLPSWCSGSEPLRERYLEARTSQPVGSAIVAAAVGWRQSVLRSIVPSIALPELATAVLARRGHAVEVSDEEFEAGLRWATEEVVPGRALLQPVRGDEDGYRAAGVVVAEVAALDAPVDTEFATALLAHLAGVELLDLARSSAASGQLDIAERALTDAAGAADGDVNARAAFHLGVLQEQRGRIQDAEAAYRQGAASEHPDHGPVALFHLGGVLEQQERTDEAIAAYRRVIAAGHADAAPRAAFNLGWLLQHHGRTEEAFDAYGLALTSGHPDAAPQAAFNLGWLYEQQRRLREAEVVYGEALESGHPDIAPMAAVSLGILLERMQRGREARSLFQRAVASGHEEAVHAARIRLRGRGGR